MLGYICVWGTTPKEKVTDDKGVLIECGGCGETSLMVGKTVVPYCSIFYIPLFPEGGGEEFMQCTNCGGKFQGRVSEIRQALAEREREFGEEIEKKLRIYEADPTNTENACELAELYLATDREGEGRRIVRSAVDRDPDHVEALHLHARILLSQEQWSQGLEVLNRALHSSPQHAGVHFTLAITHLSRPDASLADALDAAREAQRCGHPEAKALIGQIESELEK